MCASIMSCSVETRRFSWPCVIGVLAVMVMSTACAGASTVVSGWPQHGLPLGMSEEMLEEGSEAEATRAVAQVVAIARGAPQLGTHLSFTFWSEHGALTLTAYSARGRRGRTGDQVDEDALRHSLRTVLQRFAQQSAGMVEVTLERQEAEWSVKYSRVGGPRPPEAKTVPIRHEGLAVDGVAVTGELRQILEALDVPDSGEAQVELAVHLEDGRTEAFELQHFEVVSRSTGVKTWTPELSMPVEATSVVQPFIEGIGERVVHLRVRLVRPQGARRPSGWVEAARVIRPPLPLETNAAFVAEYRALHEDILRRWREETKEGAQWVARRGVEELALWYAGGIIARGVGWLGIRSLPTVTRALRRGGDASAGWLRTMLKRLPVEKKQAFERLWMKAQLEGKRALGKSEREELRGVMEGIEQLANTPLDRGTKKELRRAAREAYKKAHPEVASLMDEAGVDLPIHHRRQLEHAHLFPDEDINAADNLVLVMKEVHEPISRLWERFRRACPQATAREVEEAARIIDGHFKPWYNRPFAPPQVPYSLKEAEGAALEQLRRLIPGLD
jgi:hypothetical protein